MGMRLVIKEKQNLSEASKSTPLDVVRKLLVRSIAEELAKNPPSPFVKEALEIKSFIEKLNLQKQQSAKYNAFKIKKVFLDIGGVSRRTGPGNAVGLYYPDQEEIFLYYHLPYTNAEYKIFQELKKKTKISRDLFDAKIEIEKQKKIKSVFNKEKSPPEFMPSAEANKVNLELYKQDFMMRTYYTLEGINKKFDPGRIKGSVYKQFDNQELSEVLSITMHEIRHGYQYGKETFKKKLEELPIKDLKEPDLNYYFYQFNEYKTGSDYNIMPLNKFYYYTKPIEIDARIVQYRQFKKRNRDKDFFETVMSRERSFQESLKTIVGNFEYIKKVGKLPEQELRTKMMILFLDQFKKQDRKLFESDPRFAQELENAKTQLSQIQNDPSFVEARKSKTQ